MNVNIDIVAIYRPSHVKAWMMMATFISEKNYGFAEKLANYMSMELIGTPPCTPFGEQGHPDRIQFGDNLFDSYSALNKSFDIQDNKLN